MLKIGQAMSGSWLGMLHILSNPKERYPTWITTRNEINIVTESERKSKYK